MNNLKIKRVPLWVGLKKMRQPSESHERGIAYFFIRFAHENALLSSWLFWNFLYQDKKWKGKNTKVQPIIYTTRKNCDVPEKIELKK